MSHVLGNAGGSGIRRHHTISSGRPRASSAATRGVISEEPSEWVQDPEEAEDEFMGEWTAPTSNIAIGNDSSRVLHRQASLPNGYRRG